MSYFKASGRRSLRGVAGALLCCGMVLVSVANAMPGVHPEATKIGVSPEVEAAAKGLFKMFYAYHDDPRGMVPMTFRDAGGAIHTLDDYKGKVVVLNFWATWCAPCARELPTLKRLQDQRGGDNFTVLAASADFGMPAARILEFMKKNGAEGTPLAMLDETDGVWDVVSTGLPITFIIAPDGRVIYKMIGETDWSGKDILALVDNLLKNTRAAEKN